MKLNSKEVLSIMSEPSFSYPVIDLIATGQNLSRLRKENGFTVARLQEQLGLASPQSLYKWFRGDNLPTVDNLFALSRLFGVTIEDILVEACRGTPPPFIR